MVSRVSAEYFFSLKLIKTKKETKWHTDKNREKTSKLKYCNFKTPKNYVNKSSLVTGFRSQHNIDDEDWATFSPNFEAKKYAWCEEKRSYIAEFVGLGQMELRKHTIFIY